MNLRRAPNLAACQPVVGWHADFFIGLNRMPHSTDQPLDSHQLRVFVALAKSGSFTQAGRDLHLTQSAVSHSIRALEESAGCRLFDRMGKSAHPTPAGEQLLHHAGKILRENAVARSALGHRRHWGKSRLRVVVSPILAEGVLAQATRRFQRQMPECPLRIELASESRALNLLLAGDADLAFGVAARGDARVSFRTVFVDDLQWAVPADHAWAVAGRVDGAQIVAETLILPPAGDGTRELVDAYMRREGHSATAHFEVSGIALVLRLVLEGVGVSLLAPWNVADLAGGQGLRLLPAGRRKLRRTWSAMTLRSGTSSLAAEAFARLFGEILAAS
ncbi:MAG: LysR family transcriptional regulator [Verrucomicrobia bacterium]|nr:MAG: LysR family transcriptional regulator [Verrucomicrobiota bacterium]